MYPTAAQDELFYQLALSFVPGVGPVIGRALLERYGSATAIFAASSKDLMATDVITDVRARAFRSDELLKKAAAELEHVEKNGLEVLCIHDRYPKRLANCADAPTVLYGKGNLMYEAQKVVAIVGTRKNTDYGQKLTEDLIEGLAGQEGLMVISGLALGIDAIAHRKCVQMGIPTIGVLGHGLDRIYPPGNRQLAMQMVEQGGGILSEFTWGTLPDKGNFPMRNRVVAGMADVTVVVESQETGGALITAQLAAGYNREVAAYPGRVTDSRSAGCNNLIRNNMAAMITCADDLIQLMSWDKAKKKRAVQPQLFLHMSPDEQKIVDLLSSRDSVHADEILYHSGLAYPTLAATLLQLEMQGLIKTLPGKYYRMN